MIKWIKNQKVENILLVFSFLFLLILGVVLSYNYKIGENYNLLFDSDTARVVEDATNLLGDHYRSSVHPLFVLFVQPVVLLLSGILLSKTLSIIILSTLVSSFSVYYLYKLLDYIKPNKKLNIIISLLYLFSFSNIIFTTGIETYNFAALFLILMWYFFAKNKDKELNIYSYILLVLFGILTFAFTITNVVIYLIMIFLLFVSKKIKIKEILIVGVITIILVLGLNIGQKLVFQTTPVLWNLSPKEETTFITGNPLSKNNIKEVITNDYYNSLLSNNINLNIRYGNFYNGQNYILEFNDMSIFNFLVISIFYILLIFLVVRNYKKNVLLNTGLLLSLLFNTVLHLVYGNDSTFLYALHFLYIIVLLFGINLNTEENTKFKSFSSIYLTIFILIELYGNLVIFNKVIDYVKGIIESTYLVKSIGLPLTIILEVLLFILVIGIVILIINLIKNILSTKKKETKVVLSLLVVLLLFTTNWLFIVLDNTETFHKLLWIKLEAKENDFKPKTRLDFINQDFKDYFKEELKELDSYKEEIELFKSEYNTTPSTAASYSEYHYFGMANRRKMIYKTNSLIDIDTKEEIYHFDEESHFIIPNTYTVLIETKDHNFIILKEDEEGVHYILNGKDRVIEGTDKHISLYNFDNQKYQNMKKVLYGEILFNIKDGVIYPNIIVYENAWYRDAALTCMVLKETNNTDLVENWINSITEMYDLQNKGEKEADNLGELLYILSTSSNPNTELIDRIEAEAEEIATNNPNGYYLYGRTDYGEQFLYQNLWYKLGIESVGRAYHFDLNSIPEDAYSKMAWWSDYEIKDKTNTFNDDLYPYLTIGSRHKLGTGTIPLNENLYPLSWEVAATEAKYDNYVGIDNHMCFARTSPLHSWTASEFILLLLDDTGDLQ